MANKIVNIELNKLKPNPDNIKIFNMAKIEPLAKSIEKDGFMGAIEVIKLDDGTYEILSGHRRYEAMKLLKRKEIPAIIHEDIDEVSKCRKLLAANINNRELTAMDKARAINYYIDHVAKPLGSTDTIKDAADFFSIGQTSVKNYRRLTKYSKKLQQVLEDNLISYTGLVEDTHNFSKDMQDELADAIRKAVQENGGQDIGYKRVRQLVHNFTLELNRKKRQAEKVLEQEEKEAQKDFIEIIEAENRNKHQAESSIGMSFSDGFGGFGAFTADSEVKPISTNESIEYANEKIDDAIDSLAIALRREVKGDISNKIKQLRKMIDELENK